MGDYKIESGVTTFTTTQELRTGKFNLVAYNFDMPDTFIRGEENISTIEAYTHEVSDAIKSRLGEEVTSLGPICYAPDNMAVARIYDADFHEGAVITGTASIVVCSKLVEVSAEGTSYAQSAGSVVEGFPSSYFFGTDIFGYDSRVYMDMERLSTALSTSWPVFSGDNVDEFDFVFNVVTADGAYNYSASADGTLSFTQKIVIPEPTNQGSTEEESGFQPQVGEWKDISVNVPI